MRRAFTPFWVIKSNQCAYCSRVAARCPARVPGSPTPRLTPLMKIERQSPPLRTIKKSSLVLKATRVLALSDDSSRRQICAPLQGSLASLGPASNGSPGSLLGIGGLSGSISSHPPAPSAISTLKTPITQIFIHPNRRIYIPPKTILFPAQPQLSPPS